MRRSARDYPCNSVFPAAGAGGAAENQQIIFKPPGHCPGGFLCSAALASIVGVLFALPTWRGFPLTMPRKASSGFLSGFYSSYINSHLQAFSKQTATLQPPRNAARHFMQRVGRSVPAIAPIAAPDMPGYPRSFSPVWPLSALPCVLPAVTV